MTGRRQTTTKHRRFTIWETRRPFPCIKYGFRRRVGQAQTAEEAEAKAKAWREKHPHLDYSYAEER